MKQSSCAELAILPPILFTIPLKTTEDLSCSKLKFVKLNANSSVLGDSSDTSNTITVLDKTSSTMEGSYFQDSFYDQQIFGDQFPEDARSLVSSPHPVPPLPVITIDPVVRNKSSNSSAGPNRSFFGKGYRERLQNHSKFPDSSDSIQKSMTTSRSMGNIVCPPATRNGNLEKTTNRSETNMKVFGKQQPSSNKPLEISDKTNFYSLEEGLNWGSQISDDEEEKEQSLSKRRQYASSLTPTPRRHQEQISHDAPFRSLSRSPTSQPRQQAVEKLDEINGRYKTVLYVISNSPTDEDESNLCLNWNADHSHRSHRQEHQHRRHSNRANTKSPSSTHSDSNKPVSAAKRIQTVDGLHVTRANSRYFADETALPKTSIRKQLSPNSIMFERPDELGEQRPYFQTLPSPRQMAVNVLTNGYHNLPYPSVDSVVQPTKVRVARTDYNQVVVDIKPRQLNEADKQQHISQWIQVGTLGDSVSHPQMTDQSDSMAEDGEQSDDVYDALLFNNLVQPVDKPKGFQTQVTRYTKPEKDTSITHESDLIQPLNADHLNNHVLEKDRISEKASTPETVVTNSVENNIVLNERGHNNNESNGNTFYKGLSVDPPLTHVTELSVRHTNPLNSAPESNSLERIITIKPDLKTTKLTRNISLLNPVQTPPILVYDPASSLRITRTQSERRPRPKIAPKPTLKEQLAAILEKQPMTTTGAEIRYLNSKMSSQIASPTFSNGTFPVGHARSKSRPTVNHYDFSADIGYLERSRDTPIPNVRNLAAFFTDLIQRQRDPLSSVSSARSGDHSVFESIGLDDRDLPFSASPFMLHRETPDERERRLQAVKNLRNRSAHSSIDYTRTGSRLDYKNGQDRNSEDFNVYYTPRSLTPKPTMKFFSTNLNGHVNPLSNRI